MEQTNNSVRWRGYLWLAVCAAVGVGLTLLFLDSHSPDGGFHYIAARWGWRHPYLLVSVWHRPLFTIIYSLPALFGYQVARLFTVFVCVLTAWQTWRVARFYRLERSDLVILFLLCQPVFFYLSADTMTEPLFALVFVTALLLHLQGRVRWGALVASLMLLVRPEGFFLGAMWGVWLLLDRRLASVWWRRIPWTLLLAVGGVAWIIGAWAVTGDIQFIRHDWPGNWNGPGGVGHAWDFLPRLPEMVGPLLVIPCLIGLAVSATRRRMPEVTSTAITLFVVHSLLRAFGLFGSTGYPRYFVCIAPATALLTLAGWNYLAPFFSRWGSKVRIAGVAVLLISSLWLCFLYLDGTEVTRDAIAVEEMSAWWKDHQRPVSRFVWSVGYQEIVFDRDPWERPQFTADQAKNLAALREMPRGTLIFWDGRVGPGWFNVTADDIEAAGFSRLRSQRYLISGYVIKQFWFGYGGPRYQEMHLLYKE